MAEKSRGIKDLPTGYKAPTLTFRDIPVDDPSLAAILEEQRPKGKYFETYPVKGIKSIRKNDSVVGANSDSNTLGYVKPNLPDYRTEYFNTDTTQIPENKVIHIQPNRQRLMAQYGVFEHEKQHLLNKIREKENTWPFNQRLANADMGDVEDVRRYLPNHELGTPKWAKDANINENYISTQQAINNFYKKYHKNLSGDFRGDGFFSEVRRIEQELPPGVMLSDTALGQDIFKDRPELLTAYFNATRPEYATTIREDTGSPRYKYFEPEIPNKQQGIMSLIRDYVKKETTY